MLLVALLLLPPAAGCAQAQNASPWNLGGSNPSGYVMTADGSPISASGATLALRSTTSKASDFATIGSTLHVDTIGGRRVRLSADIETKEVSKSASLWLRADSGGRMLILDNGTDQGISGTAPGWQHREVTLFVPKSATTLVFGLLMIGSGEATARNVRIEARPAIPIGTPLAPPARMELDSALAVVRRQSLWRDTVTWSQLESDVRGMAAGSQTAQETYPAIRALLTRLGDHHSFLLRPQGATTLRTGGAANPLPVVRVQTMGVGYVSVPAYSGLETTAAATYVRAVYDSLAHAIASGAGTCRWIVDLRTNGGGNMWPMLGGLRPLLGEAGLGSFVNSYGSTPLWHARDEVDLPPSTVLVPLDSANVALLVGPRTGSSGEAVAIAFIGRPHTRTFGLPTAGLSTANTSIPLPDGAMIQLTTSVEADRTGKRYGQKIVPDEVIPTDSGATATDPQLDRAVAWLRAQSCP